MIERAIYQLLSGDAAIEGYVNDRIYVDVNHDGGSDAYLVVTLVSGVRPLFMDLSPRQKSAVIQVDAYAEDPEEVRELGEAVIALLHGKSAAADGHEIQLGVLQGEPRPAYEEAAELRRASMDFKFYYH